MIHLSPLAVLIGGLAASAYFWHKAGTPAGDPGHRVLSIGFAALACLSIT